VTAAGGIILFVHQSAELYGSDRVLLALVAKLATGPYRPVVVLPDTGPLQRELQQLGVETHVAEVVKINRAMYSPAGLLRLPGALRRCLRELDALVRGRAVQVVHSNTLAVLGGALWARRRRVPHLWHVHEMIAAPALVAWALPLLARCCADRVVANSRGTAAWLLARRPSLRARLAVICNGIEAPPPRDVAALENFRCSVAAGAGDVIVALVGRVNGGKGHAVLLEAARLLHAAGELDRFRFVLAGGPPPGQAQRVTALRSAIAASPARERITYLPFTDDIWSIWYGSDIAAVPSTAPESFGLVALEAMAAGLPVVAAAQGGLLEVVVPEATGLLVAPGDAQQLAQALLRLARDVTLRARLGQAGLRRQRHEFSGAEQAAKFLVEYAGLAKNKNGIRYAAS
jgi:glycosyltransferase involved in cell wall biosynthesis